MTGSICSPAKYRAICSIVVRPMRPGNWIGSARILPSRIACLPIRWPSKPTIATRSSLPAASSAARAPRADGSLIAKIASSSGWASTTSLAARKPWSREPPPSSVETTSIAASGLFSLCSPMISSNPCTRSWHDSTCGKCRIATRPPLRPSRVRWAMIASAASRPPWRLSVAMWQTTSPASPSYWMSLVKTGMPAALAFSIAGPIERESHGLSTIAATPRTMKSST